MDEPNRSEELSPGPAPLDVNPGSGEPQAPSREDAGATAGGPDERADADGAGAPGAEGAPDGEPRRRRRRRRRRRGGDADTGAGDDGSGAVADDDPDTAADGAREGGADGAEAAEAADVGSGPTAPRPKKRRRKARRGKDGADGGPASPTEPQGDAPPGRPAKATRPPKPGKAGKPGRPGGAVDRGAAAPRPMRSPQDATGAVKVLSGIARNLLDAEGVDVFGRPRFLDVKLRIPLDAERDAAKAAELLVNQILGRVQAVREHEAALRPGAVYCYRSNSADQRASRPGAFREIFEGFSSTGRPRFADFVTLSIERRDEGIDRLVEGDELIVTHVSMGRVLRTQQLQEFGNESPIYRILGQVDAGLFALMNSDQKAAFSFQLLRGHTLEGRTRFRLHWVGAADVRDVADPGVGQILRRFQQKLDLHALRYDGLEANGGTPPDEEEFVLPLLQELAKRLAGRARRAGRRTDHAQERTEQGQRPTTKAWEDAGQAGDDAVLRDIEEDTLVVVGPRNRCHVFTGDARHVTSFVMTSRNVQRRQQEGRWVPAEPEERGEFRIALRRRLASDAVEGGDAAPAADG